MGTLGPIEHMQQLTARKDGHLSDGGRDRREAMEQAQRQQKFVRVKTARLLETLKTNRARHVEEHKTALEGWRLKYRSALAQVSVEIEKHLSKMEFGHEHRLDLWRMRGNLPSRPESYEEEYSRAIDRLEYSEDEEQHIEHADFERLVRDNWSWKHQHNESVAMYTKG